jgi:UDP-N-acetylmuramoylalanine--D-glutamate ligase
MGRRRTYRRFNSQCNCSHEKSWDSDKAPIVKKTWKRNCGDFWNRICGPFHKSSYDRGDRKQWKTTTTMLTYHLLKSAGLNIGLGNIGKVLLCKLLIIHWFLPHWVVFSDGIVDYKPHCYNNNISPII